MEPRLLHRMIRKILRKISKPKCDVGATAAAQTKNNKSEICCERLKTFKNLQHPRLGLNIGVQRQKLIRVNLVGGKHSIIKSYRLSFLNIWRTVWNWGWVLLASTAGHVGSKLYAVEGKSRHSQENIQPEYKRVAPESWGVWGRRLTNIGAPPHRVVVGRGK